MNRLLHNLSSIRQMTRIRVDPQTLQLRVLLALIPHERENAGHASDREDLGLDGLALLFGHLVVGCDERRGGGFDQGVFLVREVLLELFGRARLEDSDEHYNKQKPELKG